ncbi:aminotransferase class I/II-fold pyridoxal phosphate-dependent enzyme [Nakamurella sp. YIM 132087]|uniref:Aminotransferase class I/II-fold pyridoxal phosphate-dependent enzyme n=1 Tax=Nakamurella alba TaxID=2665158 RepID=A0A7K1FGX1_9ACTN|nr:PLP-dependent aminotransferase family protein [Nakamurella alba]MTD12533.1 aminotransferase class I/II-fold pyridoxal phosphate-dependent enzyme [Nakamurella alba]
MSGHGSAGRQRTAALSGTVRAEELVALLGTWRVGPGSLGVSLASAMGNLIESGRLAPESRLPAQRALATSLGIARGTVNSAYDILAGAGYVTCEVGRGTHVNNSVRRSAHGHVQASSVPPGTSGILDLSVQSLQAATGVRDAIARLGREVMDPYLETGGYFACGLPVLRSAVARMLTDDGIPTQPDQILITSGAQQGLAIAARALTRHGDAVLVEDPTYRGALSTFGSIGTRAVGYPFDPDLSGLSLQAAAGARLLYCQPAVHSPTGRLMSEAGRAELARIVQHHGLMTIEDCSSRDLLMDGDRPASGLTGLVDPDLLVTIGTFSKVLWGGLRIGWIRGSARTIGLLSEVKATIDLATSVVDQLLVVDLVSDIAGARARRRDQLRSTMEAAVDLLGTYCPSWTSSPPDGGTGLWVDTGYNSVELAIHALEIGIHVAAGPSFSLSGGHTTHMRLPLGHPASRVEPALSRLAGVLASNRYLLA